MRLPDRYELLTAACWLVAAAFVVWTAVRGLGLERSWPAVPLIAFTPYVAVLAVIAVPIVMLLGRTAPGVVIGICAAVLVALVLPRVLPNGTPDPRPTGPGLRVAAANLLLGKGDVPALADFVRSGEVELLAISELTPDSERAMEQSVIGELLPHSVTLAGTGSNGTGLFSRYPLEKLPAPGEEGNELPTIIATVQMPDGYTAEAFAIHPYPPNSRAAVSGLERYLEEIPPAPTTGAPRLLIGDFNTTLDHDLLRDVLDGGYVDAADADGAGLSPTWPQELWPPPVTIDHVIVDERVEVLEYETAELPGSDHAMILAGLRLP